MLPITRGRPTTRFVVHAGRHKTGTSGLQRFMVEHPDFLARNGLYYPEFGRRRFGQHDIADLMTADSPDLSTLFSEVTGVDEQIIISTEALQTVDPAKLATVFAPADTTIVLYLREQVDYGLSWYAQKVKAEGYCGAVPHFLQSIQRQLNYLRQVRDWDAAYGADNLRLRIYDRDLLAGGSTIADFFALFAIDETPDEAEMRDANPSLGAELVAFMRLVNSLDVITNQRQRGALYARLREVVQDHPELGGKLALAPDIVDATREKYREVNERLFQRWFGGQLTNFPERPIPRPRDDEATDFAGFLGRMRDLGELIGFQSILDIPPAPA